MKTGGRKKGTPNRVTESMRAWIERLINNNRDQLELDLANLSSKDRWMVIERLMQYSIPRIQSAPPRINFECMTDDQLDEIIKRLRDGAKR